MVIGAQASWGQDGSAYLSAAQVLTLADAARAKGDCTMAEAAYRALLRAEARFRLALTRADDLKRPADAAAISQPTCAYSLIRAAGSGTVTAPASPRRYAPFTLVRASGADEMGAQSLFDRDL